jgi:uncharacterized protein DUF1189
VSHVADILLGPLLSLGSLAIYRRAARRPLSHGLTYLGWLALLFASAVMVIVSTVWLPAADEFAEWLEINVPEMQITKDGVVTPTPDRAVIAHPRLGTILVVDTSKDVPSAEDLGEATVFVGRRHVTIANGPHGEQRVFDVTQANGGSWVGTTVDGRFVHDLYGRLRAYAGPLVFLLVVAVFFVWKLLAALVYSVLGVILNRFRKEPLPYASVLNVTFFAMTMVVALQSVALLGGPAPLRVGRLAAWAITGAYLAAALLPPDRRPDSPPT